MGVAAAPSNVLKVARALLPVDTNGVSQFVVYIQGLGTRGRVDRLTGGAIGIGLEANILQAYRAILDNYAAGDELFFFGFSRGAFTIRSLIGFMNRVGIVDKSDDHSLMRMYDVYKSDIVVRNAELAELLFQGTRRSRPCPPIKFVGVWDTVAAVGIPYPISEYYINRDNLFHDIRLNTSVLNAYQALSIDERRQSFKPEIWTKPNEWKGVLEQVWFPGVHSNVGGSQQYGDGLANEALHWMAEKAERLGLQFDTTYLDYYKPCFNSRLNESLKGLYRVIGAYARPIGELPDSNQFIHQSAIDRRSFPELKYGPKNLLDALARAEPLPIANTTRTARGEPCPSRGPPLRRQARRT